MDLLCNLNVITVYYGVIAIYAYLTTTKTTEVGS